MSSTLRDIQDGKPVPEGSLEAIVVGAELEEPPAKRAKTREFDEIGLMLGDFVKSTIESCKTDAILCNIKREILSKIGKQVHVELRDVLPVEYRFRRGKEVDDKKAKTTSMEESISNLTKKSPELVCHEDFLLALNWWGAVYLQMYPGRIQGFLNHCSWAMQKLRQFSLEGVLKLESSARRVYVINDAIAWEPLGKECSTSVATVEQVLPDNCSRYYRKLERAILERVGQRAGQGSGARGSSSSSNRERGTRRLSRAPRGGGRRSQYWRDNENAKNRSPGHSGICNKFNSKNGCKMGKPRCRYDHKCHICYDSNHNALSCPQRPAPLPPNTQNTQTTA